VDEAEALAARFLERYQCLTTSTVIGDISLALRQEHSPLLNSV
jgi:hypothetical protein